MSNPIRVAIADDSIVVRQLLTEVLSEDPELSVLHVAQHGEELLALLSREMPDVVIVDVVMPVMDGMETLLAIRDRFPTLPVVMYVTRSELAEGTVEWLRARGASDAVPKPPRVGHVEHAMADVRRSLIPCLKNWGRNELRGEATCLLTMPMHS